VNPDFLDGNNYVRGEVNPSTPFVNGFLMKTGSNGQVLYAIILSSTCSWRAVRPGVEPFGALIGPAGTAPLSRHLGRGGCPGDACPRVRGRPHST
jgi:hypothetical protein